MRRLNLRRVLRRKLRKHLVDAKRRKTLQISSSESEEETSGRPIESDVHEVKTLVGRRAWKPKVENLNMKIINDSNFV